MIERTIGRLHLLAEVLTILIAGLFLGGIALSVGDSLFTIFARESGKETEVLDYFIEQYIDAQRASFESLMSVSDLKSAAEVLFGFEDVYRLNKALSITDIYKLGLRSFQFPGFSFAGSQLEAFLASAPPGDPVISKVVRAPADSRISVYFVLRESSGYIVARLPLEHLLGDIGRVASASGSLFYLATADGFVFSSSDPLFRYPVLPEIASGTLLGDNFYAERLCAIYDMRIGVLYPAGLMASIRNTILIFFSVFMAILVVLALLKYSLEFGMIIRPLNRFVREVSEWRPDSGSAQSRLGRFIPREIEILGHEFGKAGKRIEESFQEALEAREELASLNANLESRVAERTMELERVNRELGAKNDDLSDALSSLEIARDSLVSQEKMAALGKLAAGVAHELNTPLGAVISSVSFAETSFPEAMKAAGAFALTLDGESQALMLDLMSVAESLPETENREDRETIKRLRESCAASGWQNSRSMGEKLASIGVRPGAELFGKLLSSPKGEDIVGHVWKYWGIIRGISIAKRAAGKAAKVVAALKSYSWDASSSSERVEIKSEIETVLTLFENRMKYAIRLTLGLERGLVVFGNSDRLSQVWINLISNALQAMNYSGALEITAVPDGTDAVVSISDSGPGIPPEIQPKVFELFFTTKPKGEGTGLGLDICRKIVESMNGTISFESVPGRTVFTVRLPLAPAASVRDEE